MKKVILLLAIICGCVSFSFAQQGPTRSNKHTSDTVNTPYWVGMMQDPNANFFETQKAFETYWKDRKVTRGVGWKPFKRWEYLMRPRVSRTGVKPDRNSTAVAMRAYNASQAKFAGKSGGNWECLGPEKVPNYPGYEGLGRLNVIAFHPTDPLKIYAGSPSGGLWQTNNGGGVWETYTDNLPTLGVSAIVVDRTNPKIIYIGTGDRDGNDAPGMGVYKSTDEGLTWNESKTGMGDVFVHDMIQNPSDPQILIASTNQGIFRTLNGGSSWINEHLLECKSICYKPGNPMVVYASNRSQFYKSIDGGDTFTRIIQQNFPTGVSRSILAVTPADSNCIYILFAKTDGSYGGVFKSNDAGETFQKKSTKPNILNWECDGSGSGGQGWYDLALAVSPTDTSIIYVGGVNLWKSSSSGYFWSIIAHWYGDCGVAEVHADWHYLAFAPNGTLWGCNDGGVYYSEDNGNSWTDLTETMVIGQMYKLSQSKSLKEHVITGFQDNGTYTYQDFNWLATSGGDGMECIIDYDNYTYSSIYYGRIYRQWYGDRDRTVADEGIGGLNETGNWVTPYTLHPSNSNTMFLGYNSVWRCDNIKDRVKQPIWKNISPSIKDNDQKMDVLKTSEASKNMLYASRADNLFRTPDAMVDTPVWEDLTPNLPAGIDFISGIETNPIDSNVAYIVGGSSVFKTTDKGVTWTDITRNLPDIFINDIAYYNRGENSQLFLATSAGVWCGTDNSDWTLYSNGLPKNIDIREVDFYYHPQTADEDVIRACSYGRGLWSSNIEARNVAKDHVAKESNFVVVSNPNSGHFMCKIKIQTPTDYIITVYDALGKSIHQTPQRHLVTSTEIPINLGSIANGVYTVVYKTPKEQVSQKIIITK